MGKRWCRVFVCWREAVAGSEFCEEHAWQASPPAEQFTHRFTLGGGRRRSDDVEREVA